MKPYVSERGLDMTLLNLEDLRIHACKNCEDCKKLREIIDELFAKKDQLSRDELLEETNKVVNKLMNLGLIAPK